MQYQHGLCIDIYCILIETITQNSYALHVAIQSHTIFNIITPLRICAIDNDHALFQKEREKTFTWWKKLTSHSQLPNLLQTPLRIDQHTPPIMAPRPTPKARYHSLEPFPIHFTLCQLTLALPRVLKNFVVKGSWLKPDRRNTEVLGFFEDFEGYSWWSAKKRYTYIFRKQELRFWGKEEGGRGKGRVRQKKRK